MGLCKYRDMFGAPGQGLHAYRLLDVAIVDVLLTFLAGYGIHSYFFIPLRKALTLLFLSGILAHAIFCVPTTVNKLFQKS